jgi:hypothetical protein
VGLSKDKQEKQVPGTDFTPTTTFMLLAIPEPTRATKVVSLRQLEAGESVPPNPVSRDISVTPNDDPVNVNLTRPTAGMFVKGSANINGRL